MLETPSTDVLLVEDEAAIRTSLATALRLHGFGVHEAASIRDARRAVRRHAFDVVLLDIHLQDGSGLDLLRELRAPGGEDVPVIMATAYGDAPHTIEAMSAGAFDYVTKPYDLERLVEVVRRAATKHSAASKPEQHDVGSGLVGTSAPMVEVWKAIGRATCSRVPVLITGETGTGKEVVARAIHTWSPKPGPFVAVNLAALGSGVLDSELFGHERGSFTGASQRHFGRLERATGGTLFLDEIGDMDPNLQTKLLRVLQDGMFERVGGSEEIRTDARIIAATHRPVHPDDPARVLREDLYYRLAVIEIELPPLRERSSDIPALVHHALRTTPAEAVTEDAMDVLRRAEWPGNVRELIHVIRQAAARASGHVITRHELPENLLRRANPSSPKQSWETADASALDLEAAVRHTRRLVIRRALAVSEGNKSEAARLLGITRPRLYSHLAQLGIDGSGEG